MKRKPWEFYLDLKYRSLYKNKYLKGRGLTPSQIAEIMRKFKVYIDRINQSPISVRVRSAERGTQLVHILKGCLITNGKITLRIVIKTCLIISMIMQNS